MTYALQAATIDATTIAGWMGWDYDKGLEIRTLGSDGTLHETMSHVVRGVPKISLRSIALDALMDLLNTSVEVPMRNIGTSMILYAARKSLTTPGYSATATDHRRLTIAKGHLYLDSISWAPDQAVELMATLYPFAAAGGTDPVVEDNAGITLPTAVAQEGWGLTSLTAGGVSFTNVEGFSIAIGHKATNADKAHCFQSSLPYPVDCIGAGVNGPTEIRAEFSTKDFAYNPTATGTIVAVFTKYAHGGIFSGTTKTLTLNGAHITEDQKSAAQDSGATRKFSARATFDGTTRPLTWTA